MTRILITGAKSFIGTSLDKWLQQWPDRYQTETVDMMNGFWRNLDFSKYDAVFHVAGIAHVSSDPQLESLYYQINRDLAVETAAKAKAEGVGQFIFMSSIIVYGDSSSINHKRIIDQTTLPEPANFYGDSKLQAEKGILALREPNFKIVILRPPMIYGKGSKGNYPKLAKYARKLPFFPDIENERSMLHVDNLCKFISLMIDHQEDGIFFPQNAKYVKTSEMVRLIADVHGKKIRLVKVFNPCLGLLGNKIGLISKVFGNLVYDQKMSEYMVDYQVHDLAQSIKVAELD